MPEEISILSSLFVQTGEGLDNIISILRRGVEPSHPDTRVWYQDGTVSSYNVVGELGENSIPNKTNAIKVEIGNNVTSIGLRALSGCSKIELITISDNVTNIGNLAFDSCTNLTSVMFSDSVTNIGNAVFRSCSSLTSITIPNSVSSIGSSAFAGCSGLTSITIPDGVTSLGTSIFASCSNLVSITLPSSITDIGEAAFYKNTNLSSIICLATTAPTVQYRAFGQDSSNYVGYNSHSTGNNVLRIPQGATGYNASYWADPLQNASKCGFHVEYI